MFDREVLAVGSSADASALTAYHLQAFTSFKLQIRIISKDAHLPREVQITYFSCCTVYTLL